MPVTGLAGIAGFSAGATAAAGHRYWRILVTANDGHATASEFPEIEMHTSVGGADVCTGGTAIAGGGFTGSTPSNAFDNNSGVGYVPTGTSGYIGYDFGAGNEKDIVEYSIGTGASTNATALPKTFKLQWSDDNSSWTDASGSAGAVQTVSLWIINGATRTFPETLAAGFHRYFRFFMLTQNGGTSQCRINELEFRATSLGADQTVNTGSTNGPNARTISTSGDSNPDNAFDNTFDDYCYLQGATNRWVGQVYATPIKVEEISVQCNTQTTSNTPATANFDYSDDGVTWTTQKAGITFSAWSSGVAQVKAVI